MKKIAVAFCILLIVAGIVLPMLAPHTIPPFYLLLTNLGCIALTVLVMRPAGFLMRRYVARREREIYTRIRREEDMKEKMAALEREKKELEEKLDTRAQAERLPSDVNFTFKLEQMEYSKKGYIVKEEPLEAFRNDSRFAGTLPAEGTAGRLLGALKLRDAASRKVLFIRKYYYKASIGLDFSKIKYCADGDSLLFSGVRFSRLHDISGELERDGGDIAHCWILEGPDSKSTLVRSGSYDAFKQAYSALQELHAKEAMEEDADILCREYTSAFRESIKARYGKVDFVESIDDSDKTWHALKDGTPDRRISETASYMLALSDVIRKTV